MRHIDITLNLLTQSRSREHLKTEYQPLDRMLAGLPPSKNLAPPSLAAATVAAGIKEVDVSALASPKCLLPSGSEDEQGTKKYYIAKALRFAMQLSGSSWKMWSNVALTTVEVRASGLQHTDSPLADFVLTHRHEVFPCAHNVLVAAVDSNCVDVCHRLASRLRIVRSSMQAGQTATMFGFAICGRDVVVCRAVLAFDATGKQSLQMTHSDAFPLWECGASGIPLGISEMARVLRLDLEALALRHVIMPPFDIVQKRPAGVTTLRLNDARTLGVGGWSSAWRARITSDDGGGATRGVAVVKAALPPYSDLHWEAAALDVMNRASATPTIPRLLGTVFDGSVVKYTVMTPVGTPLKLASVKSPRRAFALHVARGVLDALEVAHRCGIAHCDVRPDNVVLYPPKHGSWSITGNGNTWRRPGAKAIDYHSVLVDWGVSTKTGTVPSHILGVREYVHPGLIRAATDDGTEEYAVNAEHDLVAVVYLLVALRDPRGQVPWFNTLVVRDGERPPCDLEGRTIWFDAAAAEHATAWNRAIADLLRGVTTGTLASAAALRVAIDDMAPLTAADEPADLIRVSPKKDAKGWVWKVSTPKA